MFITINFFQEPRFSIMNNEYYILIWLMCAYNFLWILFSIITYYIFQKYYIFKFSSYHHSTWILYYIKEKSKVPKCKGILSDLICIILFLFIYHTILKLRPKKLKYITLNYIWDIYFLKVQACGKKKHGNLILPFFKNVLQLL